MIETKAMNVLKDTISAIMDMDTKPINYLNHCDRLLRQTDNLYAVIKENKGNMKYIQQMRNDVFAYVEYGRNSIKIIRNDFKKVVNIQKGKSIMSKYLYIIQETNYFGTAVKPIKVVASSVLANKIKGQLTNKNLQKSFLTNKYQQESFNVYKVPFINR